MADNEKLNPLEELAAYHANAPRFMKGSPFVNNRDEFNDVTNWIPSEHNRPYDTGRQDENGNPIMDSPVNDAFRVEDAPVNAGKSAGTILVEGLQSLRQEENDPLHSLAGKPLFATMGNFASGLVPDGFKESKLYADYFYGADEKREAIAHAAELYRQGLIKVNPEALGLASSEQQRKLWESMMKQVHFVEKLQNLKDIPGTTDESGKVDMRKVLAQFPEIKDVLEQKGTNAAVLALMEAKHIKKIDEVYSNEFTRFFGSVATGAERGVYSFVKQAVGTKAALGAMLGNRNKDAFTKDEQAILSDMDKRLSGLAENSYTGVGSAVGGAIGAALENAPLVVTSVLGTYLGGAAAVAAGASAPIATAAGSALAIGLMGLEIGGSQYEQNANKRDKTGRRMYTPEQAGYLSMTQGIAEGVLEQYTLKQIGKAITGRPAMKELADLYSNAAIKDLALVAGKGATEAELKAQTYALVEQTLKDMASAGMISFKTELFEEFSQQVSDMVIENAFQLALKGENAELSSMQDILSQSIYAAAEAVPAVAGFGMFGMAGHGMAHRKQLTSPRQYIGSLRDSLVQNVMNNQHLAETIEGVGSNLKNLEELQGKAPEVVRQILDSNNERFGIKDSYLDIKSLKQEEGGAELVEAIAKQAGISAEELQACEAGTGILKVGTSVLMQVSSTAQDKAKGILFRNVTKESTMKTNKQAEEEIENIKQALAILNGKADIDADEAVKKYVDGMFQDQVQAQRAMEILRADIENPHAELKKRLKAVQGEIDAELETTIKQLQAGMKQGVDIMRTLDDQSIRTSNNAQWYRNWYADNKKEITKAELERIAYENATGQATRYADGVTNDGSPEAQQYFSEVKAKLDGLLAERDTLQSLAPSLKWIQKGDVIAASTLTAEGVNVYRQVKETLLQGNKNVSSAAAASALLFARQAERAAKYHQEAGEKDYTAQDYLMQIVANAQGMDGLRQAAVNVKRDFNKKYALEDLDKLEDIIGELSETEEANEKVKSFIQEMANTGTKVTTDELSAVFNFININDGNKQHIVGAHSQKTRRAKFARLARNKILSNPMLLLSKAILVEVAPTKHSDGFYKMDESDIKSDISFKFILPVKYKGEPEVIVITATGTSNDILQRLNEVELYEVYNKKVVAGEQAALSPTTREGVPPSEYTLTELLWKVNSLDNEKYVVDGKLRFDDKMVVDLTTGSKNLMQTVGNETVRLEEDNFSYNVPYEQLDDVTRQAVDTFLDNHEHGAEIKAELQKHAGTPWATQAIDAIRVRITMDDLIAGRKPSIKSALTKKTKSGKHTKIYQKLKANGIDGLWNYLEDMSFLGEAKKPGVAVNSTFINCRPSVDCAKFCYASGGEYKRVGSIVKSEIIDLAVQLDPIKAAQTVARQYKAKRNLSNKVGEALRLFDKGDIAEHWLPFIEELNRQHIRTQIFSKRPDILRKVNSKYNVVMLSVDESNYDMALDNDDLPLAFVYNGKNETIKQLQDIVARFKKLGGVILPVKQGQKLLKNATLKKDGVDGKAAMEAIPKELSAYVCPVDGGNIKLDKGVCANCDKLGRVGCFFGRSLKDAQKIENFFEDIEDHNSEEGGAENGSIDEEEIILATVRNLRACIKGKLAAGRKLSGPENTELRSLLSELQELTDGRTDSRRDRGPDSGNKEASRAGRTGYDLKQEGTAKGAFSNGKIKGAYSQSQNLIALFQAADQSTFMHESAHAYLEDLRKLAEQFPESQAAKDYATIMAWAQWKEGDAAAYAGTASAGEFAKREAEIKEALKNGYVERKVEVNGQEQTIRVTADELKAEWAQERFARGFEVYLQSGTAPSSTLVRAFSRFKSWLTRIYKDVTGAGVRASSEVEAIMARMVAADDEIENYALVKRAQRIQDIDADLLDTDTQAMLQRWEDQAKEDAKAKLLAQLIKEFKEADTKKHMDNYKKQLEDMARDMDVFKAEAVAKVSGEQSVVAMGFYKSVADYQQDLALHDGGYDAYIEAELKAEAERFKQQLPNAADLQQWAEDAYNSGNYATQLAALEAEILGRRIEKYANAPKKLAAAMDDVEQALAQEDKPLEKAILALKYAFRWETKQAEKIALLQDSVGELKQASKEDRQKIKDEMTAKVKELKAETMQNKAWLRGVRDAAVGKAKAHREAAKQRLSNMSIREATNTRAWIREADKAGKQCLKAITAAVSSKDDATKQAKYKEAQDAKIRQSVYTAMAAESVRLKRTSQRLIVQMKQRAKAAPKNKRLDAINKYYLGHTLYMFGLKSADNLKPTGLQPLQDVLKNLAVQGFDCNVDQAILQEAGGTQPSRSYSDLNITELAEVADLVDFLYVSGVNLGKLLTTEEYLPDVVTKLLQAHDEATALEQDRKAREKDGINDYMLQLLKPEVMLRLLDSKQGLFVKYIYQPLFEGQDKKRVLSEQSAEQLKTILDNWMPSEQRKELTEVWETLFDGQELTKENIIAMALNWGNKANRQRLLAGLNYGKETTERFVQEADVLEVFDRHMVKADWEFVQQIWDYIGQYGDDVNQVVQDCTGNPMDRVQADPFDILSADGERISLKGGYYPIKRDPSKSSVQQELEVQNQASGGQVLGMSMGSTKSRAKGDVAMGPLLLEMGVISRHVDQQIHIITMRKACLDAYRLLRQTQVANAITQQFGEKSHRILLKWVEDVWHEPMGENDILSGWGERLRGNTIKAIMAYRVSTAMLNFANVVPMADRLGVANTVKALMQFMANPRQMREFVMQDSAFMRDRANNLDRDLRTQQSKMLGSNKYMDAIDKYSNWLIAETDLLCGVPTYNWAYQESYSKAIAEGASAAEAAKRARFDAHEAVRSVLGSADSIDQAAIQRSKSLFIKALTPFYSFFNAQMNAVWVKYYEGRYGGQTIVTTDPAGNVTRTPVKEAFMKRYSGFMYSLLVRHVLMAGIETCIRTGLDVLSAGHDDRPEKDPWARFIKQWSINSVDSAVGGFPVLNGAVSACFYALMGENKMASRGVTDAAVERMIKPFVKAGEAAGRGKGIDPLEYARMTTKGIGGSVFGIPDTLTDGVFNTARFLLDDYRLMDPADLREYIGRTLLDKRLKAK